LGRNVTKGKGGDAVQETRVALLEFLRLTKRGKRSR